MNKKIEANHVGIKVHVAVHFATRMHALLLRDRERKHQPAKDLARIINEWSFSVFAFILQSVKILHLDGGWNAQYDQIWTRIKMSKTRKQQLQQLT